MTREGAPTGALANFLKMLDAGKDGALLRYSLGNEYTKAGDPERAAVHLQRAVELDPEYTAAWKMLGRALADAGRRDGRCRLTPRASRWPFAAATSRRRRKCRFSRGASSAVNAPGNAQTGLGDGACGRIVHAEFASYTTESSGRAADALQA